MIRKTRLKLTLLNSVVVFLILVCIAVFVYFSVRIDSDNNTDSELVNDVYMLKRYINLFEGGKQGANTELAEEYVLFGERMTAANTAYGIWDASGRALEYSKVYNISPEVLSGIRKCLFSANKMEVSRSAEADGIYYIHLYDFSGLRIRVCSTVVSSDSGQLRIIQAVQNVNTQDTMADRLLRWLVLAMLLGVSLSMVSGYFIAGRAIVPIQQSLTRQKEFLADASHELKTPITIMRTNLDVVKACSEDTIEEQMEWIDNAYRETERMEILINDMLQIAKTEDENPQINFKRVSLDKLCGEAAERFSPPASRQGIKIRYDLSPADVFVNGDYQKLMQVMSIVIDNAVKYSSKGDSVTISLRRTVLHGIIEVEDKGIGINASEVDKIFDRFYRTDKARSRKVGGTGLGLSIAKQIIEQHSGSISASSVKGKGTTIIITLPAAV